VNPATAAESAPIDIEKDFGAGSHERFTERVNQAQSTDYQAVLAAYDARLEAHRDDVTSEIERCRFIETFAYSEDMIIDSAARGSRPVPRVAEQGSAREFVDVLLYGVESNWGEDKLPGAQALIAQSKNWTPRQRATLYELLAERTQWKDQDLAADYAVSAVDIDPASRVLLIAVNHWVQMGAKERARRLLVEAPTQVWDTVSRSQAARILIETRRSQIRGEHPARRQARRRGRRGQSHAGARARGRWRFQGRA
jgi:hypothetical protein